MERDRTFDELLRKKIGETLGEAVDESIDADDLMFDLGMRYLRLITAHNRKKESKAKNQLTLWADDAPSKKALIDYVESVTDKTSPDYIPMGFHINLACWHHYPQDWLVWRPTCHHHRALEFVEPFLTSKYSLTVLYVWGHSYEFDRKANWELVDQIGERLTNQPQVWYATNGEIQHYLECIHRLVFTVAQDAVYNPTDQTIWMTIDNDRILAIESGKTVRIE